MNELIEFVGQAIGAGYSRSEIREVLGKAGWDEDEVSDALSRFADTEFKIAVPKKRPRGDARDAYLYLVTFMTLYTWIVSLGVLLFGLIDKAFPDPVADRYDYGGDNEAMRWAIASIIVGFPIYLGFTIKHIRDYIRNPERRSSSVRKWLTYLTLFVAASTIICDLVTLVAGVLGGEMANRFILKCLTVLALAGGTFGFYLWEVRFGERRRP